MGKKTHYIQIPQDLKDKWENLWQSKDALELAEILDITPGSVRVILRRGTIANQDMINKIDSYYSNKLFILNQYE